MSLSYFVSIIMILTPYTAEERLSITVFGYARDSLTSIPGFALQTVTIGSITAGIGLVIDAWLLLFYSGADAAKFQACPFSIIRVHVLTSAIPGSGP